MRPRRSPLLRRFTAPCLVPCVPESHKRYTTKSYGFLTFVSSLLHGDSVQYRPNVTELPALERLSKGCESAQCRNVHTRSEASYGLTMRRCHGPGCPDRTTSGGNACLVS